MVRALAPHTASPVGAGVYLLLDGSEVIYIGQTLDVVERLARHRRNWRTKNYDAALFISVSESDLDAYEGALIRALRPTHNKKVRGPDARDAEILQRLGLTGIRREPVVECRRLDLALVSVLRAARVAINKTQTEIAAQLNVTQPCVARWESGAAKPRNLLATAAAYGIEPAALLAAIGGAQ